MNFVNRTMQIILYIREEVVYVTIRSTEGNQKPVNIIMTLAEISLIPSKEILNQVGIKLEKCWVIYNGYRKVVIKFEPMCDIIHFLVRNLSIFRKWSKEGYIKITPIMLKRFAAIIPELIKRADQDLSIRPTTIEDYSTRRNLTV